MCSVIGQRGGPPSSPMVTPDHATDVSHVTTE